jgi:hypothetical protein
MAPYKEKVEFEPMRKHGLIRTTGIWISGLIASFLFGVILGIIVQKYLKYKCIAIFKSFANGCLHEDPNLNLAFAITAIAAFICIRLWFGRK